MRLIMEDTSKDNTNKRRVVIETETDNMDITEVGYLIHSLLCAYSFHPDNVNDLLKLE